MRRVNRGLCTDRRTSYNVPGTLAQSRAAFGRGWLCGSASDAPLCRGGLVGAVAGQGDVWLLDPKEHCSWCWIYVGKTVWVKLGKRSATLLNPKGETAECWNGGQMSKY